MEETVETKKAGVPRRRRTALAALCAVGIQVLPLPAKDAVLIVRPPGASFEDVVKGISDEIEDELAVCELVTSDGKALDSLAARIADEKPSVIVLMDNTAIELLKSYHNSMPDTHHCIPSVSCMAVDMAKAVSGLKNAVGIAYEVPIVTSMVALRSLLEQQIRTVGVVYREGMQDLINGNRPYCEKEGFEIVGYSLPDNSSDFGPDIQAGLRHLLAKKQVDALWVPNDNVLLTPTLIEERWSPAIEKAKIPVVVGVRILVNPALNMGTFAVLPDHVALGAQVAARIFELRGNALSGRKKTVEKPLSVRKHVNLDQARRFFSLTEKQCRNVDKVLTGTGADQTSVELSGMSAQGRLSLGDLLNMRVTSVSKKAERLMDVSTSIYVLTAEDIRRSAASRLSDVLSLVPGAWVTERSYTSPNASIRDVTEAYGMTVNVLVDGVPVINPIVGGLFYEGLNIPLEEIERIEVIKGPGGTIYGANSATGIINIITRNARKSRGLQLGLGAGTRQYVRPYARYATKLGSRVALAGHASFTHTRGYERNPDFAGDTVTSVSPESNTPRRTANLYTDPNEGRYIAAFVGADLNAALSKKYSFDGQGWYQLNRTTEYAVHKRPVPDYMVTEPPEDSIWPAEVKYDNAALSGRFNARFSSDHNGFCHVYWFNYLDLCMNAIGSGVLSLGYHVLDVEVQDNLRFFADRPVNLEVIGGGNVRTITFDIDEAASTERVFEDPRNREYIGAVFVQDRLTFLDQVDVTTGVKAEVGTLTKGKPLKAMKEADNAADFVKEYPEYAPSVRLTLRRFEKLTLWGAWSRSVTTPAYIHTNMEMRREHIPPEWAWDFAQTWQHFGYDYQPGDSLPPPPAVAGKWVAVVSTKDLGPTEYKTSEFGFRSTAIPRLTADYSLFHSRFQGAITDLPIDSTWQTVIPSRLNPGDSIVPVYTGNLSDGYSWGMEAVVRYAPMDLMRLETSYSLMKWVKETLVGSSASGNTGIKAPHTPEHIVRFRCYLDFPRDVYVTISGLWHSEYDLSHLYNYFDLKHSRDAGGIDPRKPESGVKLDARIEKRFLNDRLSMSLWGRNILSGHTVESYLWYLQAYPHTIHRMFGATVACTF